MKEDKQHLNIDLEFLDKKESLRVASKPKPKNDGESSPSGTPKQPSSPTTTDTQYNWKKILLIGGVVLFFGWAIFSDGPDSGSSSSSNVTSNDSTFTDGSGQTFRCSDYNYDQAMALKPSDSESATLDARISANNIEKSNIENMYVDEYNQNSIDQYNEVVDTYNLKNNRLKSDLSTWDTKINTYNNFLDAHCTPE